MARETYVIRDGKLVPKNEAHIAYSMDAPGIISDHFRSGALLHPITGQMIDSKSTFRRITKDHGGEEIGNERQQDRRSIEPPCAREDVGRAIGMLKQGYRPSMRFENDF